MKGEVQVKQIVGLLHAAHPMGQVWHELELSKYDPAMHCVQTTVPLLTQEEQLVRFNKSQVAQSMQSHSNVILFS